MTYTEDEAKTKWCPFYRAESTEHNRGNSYVPDKGYTGPFAGACIASECMAWRWETEKERERTFHSHGPAPDPEIWERVSPLDGMGTWPTYRRKQRHGWCGLAGKP